jgi:hypothetical protein
MSETIATICSPYLSSATTIATRRKITAGSGPVLGAHQKRSDRLDGTRTDDNQGKGQWCDRHPGYETCAVTRGAGRQESTEVSQRSGTYSRRIYKRDLTKKHEWIHRVQRNAYDGAFLVINNRRTKRRIDTLQCKFLEVYPINEPFSISKRSELHTRDLSTKPSQTMPIYFPASLWRLSQARPHRCRLSCKPVHHPIAWRCFRRRNLKVVVCGCIWRSSFTRGENKWDGDDAHRPRCCSY